MALMTCALGGAGEGNRTLTASLGSSLGPFGTGRSYSSAGTGTDRGCPWMTARNRWLGHVGGTAAEDGAGLRRGSDGHQLDRRARSVLGDRLPRWQVAGGDAAGLLRAPGRSEPDNHDEPSEAQESPEGEEHNADDAVLPGHDQHGPHVDDQARAEHGHAGPEAPGSESREGHCVTVLLGECGRWAHPS